MKNRLNPAKRDILPKKLFLGISLRRLILPPNSLRAAPFGAASKPLLLPTKNHEVQFGALCLKMHEPILSERTDAPPRHRSLTLATPKKSFVRISDFACAGFFLPRLRRGFGGQVKGKQNFSLVFCSGRAGGGALRTSLRPGRHPPPHPLPPSPPRLR